MCIMKPDDKQKIINEYMPRLEEFIVVDEKIVSPKTLSHLLHVDHQTSHLLINEYHKKHSHELYTWYVLSGERKAAPHYGFHVCSQDKLEYANTLFKSEPSKSISSIQKLGVDTSFEAKIAADMEYFPAHEDLLPIRVANIKRKIIKSEKSLSSVTAVPSFTKESKPVEIKKEIQEKAAPEEKKELPKEKNVSSKSTPFTSSKKSISNNKSSKGNKGAIGNFFGKQAAASSKKTQDKDDKKVKESESKIKEQAPADDEPTPMDEDPQEETPPKASKVSSKSSLKKKKPKKPKKSSATSKKRKRIMTASDSESEEDESNEDDLEEEPLEEPPPQPVFEESDDEIIPPTPVTEKGRKRVRKQIDKTFEDADGFIITKKEYVYESCSDSNDASPSKKPKNTTKSEDSVSKIDNNVNSNTKPSNEVSPKKSTVILAESKTKGKGKNKETSPQKGKQTSLMNFFKKK